MTATCLQRGVAADRRVVLRRAWTASSSQSCTRDDGQLRRRRRRRSRRCRRACAEPVWSSTTVASAYGADLDDAAWPYATLAAPCPCRRTATGSVELGLGGHVDDGAPPAALRQATARDPVGRARARPERAASPAPASPTARRRRARRRSHAERAPSTGAVAAAPRSRSSGVNRQSSSRPVGHGEVGSTSNARRAPVARRPPSTGARRRAAVRACAADRPGAPDAAVEALAARSCLGDVAAAISRRPLPSAAR